MYSVQRDRGVAAAPAPLESWSWGGEWGHITYMQPPSSAPSSMHNKFVLMFILQPCVRAYGCTSLLARLFASSNKQTQHKHKLKHKHNHKQNEHLFDFLLY